MRRSSVKEYTDTMKWRYTGASRTEKGALLDEYVKVSGYHRKSAIRHSPRSLGQSSPHSLVHPGRD